MKTTFFALSTAMTAALLTGCIATTPHYDAHFGESVLKLESQQIADPAASLANHPASGLDAKSAKSAIVNYNNGARAPSTAAGALTTGSGTSGN